jgi:hypothetical protein
MANPQVQAKLDGLLARVDTELGRAAADYQGARGDLAAHHAQMETEAERAQGEADALRPALEAQVFGGQESDPAFAAQARRYQEQTSRAGAARLAARLAFGATQPPGAVPTGKPLGTRPLPAGA